MSEFTLNVKGKLWSLDQPKIMGILNVTPDSFFDGGQYLQPNAIFKKIENMVIEGADIIDIGAMSSRPFSKELSENEELERLKMVLPTIMTHFPNLIYSIDTYRYAIAQYALDLGVAIINDITAGQREPSIWNLAQEYKAPYIAMHMQGMPETMQNKPEYHDIIKELLLFFDHKINQMRQAGLIDIIIDPGFGFGKTIEDNFQILKNLNIFQELKCPLLVGISRKSMIYKSLHINASEALNGTSALHFEALRQGAKILRVHDVKEAKEVVRLWLQYDMA